MRFLPPFVGHPQVWDEHHIPPLQYLCCFGIETSVAAASRQPNHFGHKVRGYKSRLFAFDHSHRFAGTKWQQMFAEETLPQVEVGKSENGMHPSYIYLVPFDAMTCRRIVGHNFASADSVFGIDLPIDCRTSPLFGGADIVQSE